MTSTEEKIWNLVHNWCNGQACEINDFAKRALMDNIKELVESKEEEQPLVDPDTMHMFEILEPKNVQFWQNMYAGLPKEEQPEPVWNGYLREVEKERARLKQIN